MVAGDRYHEEKLIGARGMESVSQCCEGGYFIQDGSGKASGRCRCWEGKHFRQRRQRVQRPQGSGFKDQRGSQGD